MATTLARRVTVVAPRTRMDITVPAETTIAELVPQLVRLSGVDADDPTASSGGWLLSRLGEEPLAPAVSVAAAGVDDGELLYLTPRNERLPPVLYDDIVDAIAAAVAQQPGSWRPQTFRRVGLTAAALLFTGGAVLLPRTGLPGPVVGGLAATLCLVLLAAALSLSRAVGDAGAGAVLAGSALGYGLALARVLPAPAAPAASARALPLLYLAATTLVVAVAGAVAVGAALPWFTAAATTAALVTAAAVGWAVTGATVTSVAAVTAALITAARPVLPVAARALARLPVPVVPADLEGFRQESPPVPEASVTSRAAAATAQLSALLAAVVAVLAGCAVVLTRSPGTWPVVLAALIGVSLLLRGRAPIRSRDQRLLYLGSGALAVAAVTVRLGQDATPGTRLVVVAAVLAVAVVAAVAAVRMPGRVPSPLWGRMAEVLEYLVLAAVLPVAAQVIGLVARVRGWGG